MRDRGVVGVVIDTMALDGPGTSGALRELLQRDAYVVANANLTEALPARRYWWRARPRRRAACTRVFPDVPNLKCL